LCVFVSGIRVLILVFAPEVGSWPQKCGGGGDHVATRPLCVQILDLIMINV